MGWDIPLRDGLPKKNSCSFGFCPNCIYWVNSGMGREGETPAQIFWHIGVQKKWYKLSKLGGGGVEVIWTKSKRTATFFSGNRPSAWLNFRVTFIHVDKSNTYVPNSVTHLFRIFSTACALAVITVYLRGITHSPHFLIRSA